MNINMNIHEVHKITLSTRKYTEESRYVYKLSIDTATDEIELHLFSDFPLKIQKIRKVQEVR